ncbi:unnamed protein product [Cunninghamella blakesleeana]
MAHLFSPIPTPSHSNRSYRSIKSLGDESWLAKDECHSQADNTLDDWSSCLKDTYSNSHEETMKTAKLFTQVDTYSKHTLQTLEKTNKTLDQLFNQQIPLLSTVSTLTEIQSNLGLEQLVKSHWLTPPSPANNHHP